MKVLRIEDSGFVWEVEAAVIAENRASYYAQNDGDTTYEDEFEHTIGDDYEIRDWFLNNMDWPDVEDRAKLVQTPGPLPAPRLNDSSCSIKVVNRG